MKTTGFAIATLATSAFSMALPAKNGNGGGISVTPHADYSSSVGVLGCKVDTNRIAYWPSFPSCDNMCVKVSANGRSVTLLHVDQSGGAYDISYNSWNYLMTGKPATEDPVAGGGMDATYETVDMSECEDIITDPSGKLAFSAANSVNFVVGCGAKSWVGQNNILYNIGNTACTVGVNDVCTMPPLSQGNQPVCHGSQLGVQPKLKGHPVWNIQYPSGDKVRALQ